MKLNDIRKLAKEIRNGVCTLGYNELAEAMQEINDYVNSPAAENWTDRTKAIIDEEATQIASYMMTLAPKAELAIAETSEDKVGRKNFKSVVRLYEQDEKEDPVLEAVRWFAMVYAKDGYEKVKCVKGMIERRGYKVFWSGAADARNFQIIGKHGEKLGAFVGELGGNVEAFDIYQKVA